MVDQIDLGLGFGFLLLTCIEPEPGTGETKKTRNGNNTTPAVDRRLETRSETTVRRDLLDGRGRRRDRVEISQTIEGDWWSAVARVKERIMVRRIESRSRETERSSRGVEGAREARDGEEVNER